MMFLAECTSLTSLTIGNSVKTIGSTKFLHFVLVLTSITIPNSVTTIGSDHIFAFCTSLTEIQVPSNAKKSCLEELH